MSSSIGPGLIEDGLVFYYDMENAEKSWKGKPTTNLSFGNFFSGNGNFTTNETIQDVLPDGTIGDVRYLNADYVADPNRTVSIGNYSLTAGQTYTLSFYTKNINCTGFSGNLYTPGLGRVIGGIIYPTIYTDRWTRVITTFTMPNEGVNPVSFSPQAFRDGGYGFFKMCWLQLEEGNFATPFVDGTRSNTQAILDLTGNNTVTADSLTYNSDGTFSFDGTSSSIYPTSPVLTGTTSGTILFWVKSPTTYDGISRALITKGGGTGRLWIWCNTSGTVTMNTYWGSGFDYYMNGNFSIGTNSWNCVAVTIDRTGNKSIFHNGELKNSTNISGASSVSWANSVEGFGAFNQTSIIRFNGLIANAQIYNRALSAAEVKRNFNAIKWRYGL